MPGDSFFSFWLMIREDTDSLPPMARLYDVMQQRGRSIYSRRLSNQANSVSESARPRNASRSFASASPGSSNPVLRPRRTKLAASLKPTQLLIHHPGDSAEVNDCELGKKKMADVPPPPPILQHRNYTRSPLTDGSFASTADS